MLLHSDGAGSASNCYDRAMNTLVPTEPFGGILPVSLGGLACYVPVGQDQGQAVGAKTD